MKLSKEEMIRRLLNAWLKHSSLRFGQFLENVASGEGLFYMPDDRLVELAEKWDL